MGLGSPRQTVLVTGAAGFIGSHLSERLVQEGYEVIGLDNLMTGSQANLASIANDPRFHFEVGDVRDWSPSQGPVDVLVSNAMLQWVPGHLDLLPRLIGSVAPGGWLAFQVPGNMGEPSHVLRRELAAAPPYSEHTRGIAEPASHDPETYLRALRSLGCGEVDAWETTYLHVLHGEDPVLSWISGTSLRPTLAALPEDLRERFTTELGERLREAYPSDGAGGAVVLPFRRVFVVAQR